MQVEEVRNPALKGKPVGVTQKYLIVTSNYEARARGVTKLTGIQEALAACPELELVSAFINYFPKSRAILWNRNWCFVIGKSTCCTGITLLHLAHAGTRRRPYPIQSRKQEDMVTP